MSQVVRTRFAPSPTGYLHIGGARTALFNYLLAKRLGGKFVLRIEDTDQARNITGADNRLLADLRWLGLNWDEGPEVGGIAGVYHQSQRLAIYQQYARNLIEQGRAYYAFDTRDELDAMRSAAQREKRNFRYPRPAAFPSEADAQRARADGRPVVVRFARPQRSFLIRDQILGEINIPAEDVDDIVLLKADGWPTYHFAVVVDDGLMQVTHVLRGQEHLLNTANHLGLQEALGFPEPVYGHLPIILNLDGSKMSKREKDRAVRKAAQDALAAGKLTPQALQSLAGVNAATLAAWRGEETQLDSDALAAIARELGVGLPEIEVHDFRAAGYLPEVLCNFIALLGWSPGDGREHMSLDELSESFSLDRVGKTNARFDRAKLLNFNTQALAEIAPERAARAMREYLATQPNSPLAGLDDATWARLVQINEGRRTLRDVETKSRVLYVADDAYPFERESVEKVLHKGERAGVKMLRALRDGLARHSDWSPAGIEALLRAESESSGQGLGKIAQPLRVAVTGTTVSPPIFDTLALLGRERTLRRIDRCLVLCA